LTGKPGPPLLTATSLLYKDDTEKERKGGEGRMKKGRIMAEEREDVD
jgi:hypothetical protein